MKPYPNPTTNYEYGPQTATTPSLVAHGSQSNFRVLNVKGNPAGHLLDAKGNAQGYLSSRMEHYHQPLEHAMLEDNGIDIDTFHLGQTVPRVNSRQPNSMRPDPASIFAWPDTSVMSAFRNPNLVFEGEAEGMAFGPGQKYIPSKL